MVHLHQTWLIPSPNWVQQHNRKAGQWTLELVGCTLLTPAPPIKIMSPRMSVLSRSLYDLFPHLQQRLPYYSHTQDLLFSPPSSPLSHRTMTEAIVKNINTNNKNNILSFTDKLLPCFLDRSNWQLH